MQILSIFLKLQAVKQSGSAFLAYHVCMLYMGCLCPEIGLKLIWFDFENNILKTKYRPRPTSDDDLTSIPYSRIIETVSQIVRLCDAVRG